MAQTTLNENDLREALKRCPEASVEAALQFRESRDPALLPTIVLGIIERFVEPEVRPAVREAEDKTRLLEDLGIDSLLMVEIVILVEETLEISIENEELRDLRSIGDLKAYLDAKIKGEPLPEKKNNLDFAQIAAALPHQSPFLFLQEARINGELAEGTYAISGDEVFLEGHFKGNPVFPASLMIEALGQLAVLFMLRANHPELGEAVEPESVYFVSCDGVRCHQMMRPGDTLNLKVRLKKVHAPLAKFEGWITNGGNLVAKVEEVSLTFAQGASPDEAEA